MIILHLLFGSECPGVGSSIHSETGETFDSTLDRAGQQPLSCLTA